MRDYEYLIKELVHEKMTDKVRGKVCCWIRNDTLCIKVEMKESTYIKSFDDLANRILHGFTADSIVYEFCNCYRKYVLGGYFR